MFALYDMAAWLATMAAITLCGCLVIAGAMEILIRFAARPRAALEAGASEARRHYLEEGISQLESVKRKFLRAAFGLFVAYAVLASIYYRYSSESGVWLFLL
jgi:hypothetical protein